VTTIREAFHDYSFEGQGKDTTIDVTYDEKEIDVIRVERLWGGVKIMYIKKEE